MRNVLPFLLALALSGCLADVLVSTAVQGELGAKQATAAQNTLNRVTNDTGKINLQHAVDTYSGETGYPPESLDALVPNFINPIPQRADGGNFGYNPITGRILDTDEGPSSEDYLLMEDIGAAINAYGNATGYYPETLDTLFQTGYLAQLPRTTGGLEFAYDKQTGAFNHPLGGTAQPQLSTSPNRGGGGVGGAGPMGEVMTGIAIQDQLNSNSNAGASQARSTGAEGIGNATATTNDRQQKALDDLGF